MAEQQSVNHSMDRRREEKASENMMQDHTNRLAGFAADGLEIWQKQLAFGERVATFWVDTFSAAQNSISHMLSSVQSKRAG